MRSETGQSSVEHMALRRDTKKPASPGLSRGKEIPASDLAYAKTEVDPLMGKRVEVRALENDINELIVHMRRAAQEGQNEQYTSFRDAALKKLDQIIFLRGAFGARAPEWKEISRYWEITRGIIGEIEREQSGRASVDKEARTSVFSPAAISGKEKSRFGDTKSTIQPWEQQFFEEYPEARKALFGKFNVPEKEWIPEPLPWEKKKTPVKSEPVAARVTGDRPPFPKRSALESLAIFPNQGWEKALTKPLMELGGLFAKWFVAKGVSMGKYERYKYEYDPVWQWLKKGGRDYVKPDPEMLELGGSFMILYERLKALRDALRDEDVKQASYVLELLEVQLQSMRAESKTEAEIIQSVRKLTAGINAIINEKKKTSRKSATHTEERALP